MPQDRTTADQLKATLTGGLIPAAPVMFDRDGHFHERAHEAYVEYMRTQAVAGVAVWAHTGRGLHLDAHTAKQVIDDWRTALPNKPLIAGVGSNDKQLSPKEATDATLRMASSALEHGADALLVYPPSWLKHHESRDSLIVEHHARLAELGIPLVLFYLYEAAGGVQYNTSVLDQLLTLPNVAGIKMATLDSVMTYQDVTRHIQAKHPAKLLITGEDRFLGYSLRRGARAALIGLGSVCCDLQAELITSHFEGNAERFLELSDLVDQLAEVLFVAPMEGYIGRILCALAKLGIIPRDAAFDPWGPQLTAKEIDNIGVALDTLTAVAHTE
ncbi:MAG TPA: dihydrodipicolinate synthase family protein [Pyrinomonadaceae bacterium]|nr:dihydrodipicolinate synthase family protein [Pyrinomonadaceae bacterium]